MYTQHSSRRRWSKLLAVPAALALVAAACGDDEEGGGGDTTEAEGTEAAGTEAEGTEAESTEAEGTEAESTEAEGTEAEGTAPSGGGGEINFAWIGWEENVANTNLWAEILSQEGYDVTLQGPLEPGPAFQAVAGGDSDLFMDVWMPTTHAGFMDEVGDQVENLGTWFEGATVELTVPSYVEEVNSLADLADNAEMFDSTITGIEAGAGMMGTLQEEVVPAYGLEDWTVQASSTAAMRQELEDAYENEEPIVVTLWTPHPEYVDKDLKRLEDPEGAFGSGEELQIIARDGFSEEFPEVATWIENFEMTADQVGALEGLIEEAGEGNEREGAAQWIEENQDVVDGWLQG